MNYENDKTFWWLLQIQLPDRDGMQRKLFSSPIPRQDLLKKSVNLIPKNIRISRSNATWGFADLAIINDYLFSFYLTISSPNALIAEETEPGYLRNAKDPRFYTLCVINITKQIIMVHRSSDVSRYARSAKTFADIFQKLLENAISSLDMSQHYLVEVEPIAKYGSFVEWVNTLDYLKKIIIKHTGSNLPSGANSLISNIKETANQYKRALKSKYVELVANEPDLNNEDITELDKAAADRRLNLRAKGIKSNVGSTWSSSEKPIPETAIMSINTEQLQNVETVARSIDEYINNRFNDR